MSIRYLLFLFILIGFTACQEETSIEDPIEGVWVANGYEDDTFIYKKAKEFDGDKAGLKFGPNGSLTIRQNMGWCATPPVTYDNFDGIWVRIDAENLTIHETYWGGERSYEMEIVSIDQDKLTVRNIW